MLRGLDGIGVGEVVVIGLSMGGYTALALLRLAPERVRALVLASSRASADTPEQAENRRTMAGLALRDGVETAVPMVKRLLGPRARGEPHIADPVVGRIRRCRPAGIAACQSAMASRPDSTSLLGSVTVPALVIHGDQDAIVSLDEARAVAAAPAPGGAGACSPGRATSPTWRTRPPSPRRCGGSWNGSAEAWGAGAGRGGLRASLVRRRAQPAVASAGVAAAGRVSGHRAEALVVDRLGDRRVLAADRALGVAGHPELAEAHVEGVDVEQATGQRLADARGSA